MTTNISGIIGWGIFDGNNGSNPTQVETDGIIGEIVSTHVGLWDIPFTLELPDASYFVPQPSTASEGRQLKVLNRTATGFQIECVDENNDHIDAQEIGFCVLKI